MQKVPVCERREVRLVGATDESDAIYWVKREIEYEFKQNHYIEFKQWQVAKVRDYGPGTAKLLINKLREGGVKLINDDDNLFAVTVHFEASIYVELDSTTDDTGLAGESGVSMASDGKGEGEGSSPVGL